MATFGIGLRDLKPVVDRNLEGFSGLNTGKLGCTPPWSRLQNVGQAIIKPDQGFEPVLIHVSDGFIRNNDISKYYKRLYSREVMPAIKIFLPDAGNTFKLLLHFRQEVMQKVFLEN